jgi:hypothetical protein
MTTQQWIYTIEWAILAGLLATAFYRSRPERRALLKKTRKVGCISGGCALPLLFLFHTMLVARSAADLGGPLFWPLFAGFGGALGFALATLYFIIFRRGK